MKKWCSEYDYQSDEHAAAAGRKARSAGYLTKAQLVTLMRWKANRIVGYGHALDHHYLRTVTEASFSSTNERFRIESLTLLRGVKWPMASTILHFVWPKKYPILDFRALWSLQAKVPNRYDYNLWYQYCGACRMLAKEHGISLRDLDKALWQYSSKHQ